MMMQSGDGPTIFSAETNPYLRQREGDTFSIFGKKIKKKTVSDILGRLAGRKSPAGDMSADAGSASPEGIDILSKLSGGGGSPMSSMWEPPGFEEMDGGFSPKPKMGSAPVYDPAKIYGGFLSMYGGKKVKGGLLGE
jgi:hypothetical protein